MEKKITIGTKIFFSILGFLIALTGILIIGFLGYDFFVTYDILTIGFLIIMSSLCFVVDTYLNDKIGKKHFETWSSEKEVKNFSTGLLVSVCFFFTASLWPYIRLSAFSSFSTNTQILMIVLLVYSFSTYWAFIKHKNNALLLLRSFIICIFLCSVIFSLSLIRLSDNHLFEHLFNDLNFLLLIGIALILSFCVKSFMLSCRRNFISNFEKQKYRMVDMVIINSVILTVILLSVQIFV